MKFKIVSKQEIESLKKIARKYKNLRELLMWMGEFPEFSPINNFLKSDEADYHIWNNWNTREEIRKIVKDRKDDIKWSLEVKSESCENCEWFKDNADAESWCVNEEINKIVDPDGKYNEWFTPPIGFVCSQHEPK